VRHVYLDVPHSTHVKISPYGESVGHYENGDTLVVDTIGLSDDLYRQLPTPHTKQLHVIERFTVTEGGKAAAGCDPRRNPGAFNMPWSAAPRSIADAATGAMEEPLRSKTTSLFDASVSEIPKADRPDF